MTRAISLLAVSILSNQLQISFSETRAFKPGR